MSDHILVVDDEESIRYTFEFFLSDKGYKVTSTDSCEAALALIEENDFSLIYADILLGGKSGIEFLKVLKEQKLDVPVVIITGMPSLETAAESLRLGAFDYIIKPILKDTLLRVTSVALRHKALADEKEKFRLNIEAIFHSVKDGIITVDKQMKVMEINGAVEKLCGFSRIETVGRVMSDLTDRCNGSCLHALKETLTTHQPVEISFVECQYESLVPRVVSITVSPLVRTQDQIAGAVMVVRDETAVVTLERQMEQCRGIDKIVSKNAGMDRVRSLLRDLADTQTTVLITGESGAGKEMVVEALHYMGERQNGPLVKVNCAALSENLLESELFGHVSGAFTGATKNKIGRFQLADGGTIFLDEIGDLSPGMQLRLLRVIESKEFERVGDGKPVKVNVRVVTATHRDLSDLVSRNLFREDLYYRLKVVHILIPPLRERQDDIPLLVEQIRCSFNKKFNKQIKGISSDVERMFLNYPWPGNVRELENIMEHAFIRCHKNVITAENMPSDFQKYFEKHSSCSDCSPDAETKVVQNALRQACGNKTEAARALGVSRRTIYRKMEKLGIDHHP
jgi:PAS domain S-box-containing protein